ncbi:MAG: matrixin family metalloprotease [Gemmatimonas sp.]|jgi:hypothetical protein|uniref:matrixin family metalloprotease n=1 Tax=Gemmatimonas sp. TaxID=1962908 RepID=UPI00391FA2D3|nr:matrixin family metalloprotease [Gemmatimonadota bacterium]
MKSTETLLACCVVGLACFVVGQSIGSSTTTVLSEAGGAIEARVSTAQSRGDGDDGERRAAHGVELLVSAPPLPVTPERPSMPAADVRRRLSLASERHYLDEILLARDSALARWPERTTRPLRVFVHEADSLAAWNPEFLPAVRDAFGTWVQAGIPVRFTFVASAEGADVQVSFVERFGNDISGKTVWSRDAAYWLVSSTIDLAVAHPDGSTVTPPQMRAVALHEVGHLLGLDHTAAPDHIMSARIRVRELSEADRATVRLLYSVPAGNVKQ